MLYGYFTYFSVKMHVVNVHMRRVRKISGLFMCLSFHVQLPTHIIHVGKISYRI